MNRSKFVVQEHWARTHHYDFRLERDGVFKSWVLRKTFPQVPGVRRLAIQVEDHALSFGDFEGQIPTGEYGAGKVVIWDRGDYVASRWGAARITFRLHGNKLNGEYSLILFRRAGAGRWLLVKHRE